jgi:hypothetical protein
MTAYFTEPSFVRPGRPINTLPGQLDTDLGLLPPRKRRYRLKNLQQFIRLTSVAQNRIAWRDLTDTVLTAHKEKADNKRHIQEVYRRVPTFAQLNNLTPRTHTPAGMDFRSMPRRIRLIPEHLPMIDE